MSTSTTETPQADAAVDAAGPPPVHVPHRVSGPIRWWDWVLAADPGLLQLQAGWRALVSMSVALTAGYELSDPLGVPVFLSMLLGGLMGFLSCFLVAEKTPLRLARAILWMPLPFSAVLPLVLWLHPHRILSMCLIGLLAAMIFVLARFGPIWLTAGTMMFAASMFGMVAPIPLALWWRILILGIATTVAMLVAWLVLCYPMPREDLLRTQRAFLVEARRVTETASVALTPNANRARAVRRMRRTLRRLNITTLTIDGHLDQPAMVADPHTAELLHQYLFDAELALQGIGQAVQQLASRHVPTRLREALVVSLVIAQDTHLGRADALRPAADLIRQQAGAGQEGMSAEEAEVRALARRVGDLLDAFADALACWLNLGENSPTERARVPFRKTVVLVQNRPAGTALVAQRAGMVHGASGWRGAVPSLRTPLQTAIAIAIVCPITDAIDPGHFYWGISGVMLSLFGVSTTPDRLRKLAHRLLGTAVGAVLGIGALHLIGPGHIYQTTAFIVVAMSLCVWGMQRQYAYFVVGLVAALTQLYGLSMPYSDMNWLLTKRLIDNGVGIVIATVCAAVIFPVSNSKIDREAKRGYLSALEQLIAQVAERWRDPEAPTRLRGAARGVDAALFQLRDALKPLVRMPLGVRGRRNENLLALFGTATQHAHALATAADIDLAAPLRARAEQITEVFTDSLHALQEQITTGRRSGRWTRVSPMIRESESLLLNAPTGRETERLGVALRELSALDEVLANLADTVGLSVIIAPKPPAAADTTAAGHSDVGSPAPRVAGQGLGRHRAGGAAGPSRPADRADAPERAAHALDPTHTAATGAVSGTLRCPVHPGGCEAWITIVTGQGQRWTQGRTVNGRYQITGLPPGAYTLIASSSQHAPYAQFLLVDRTGQQLRHDIALGPAR
ncbi:FUSC family protein [Streptomyces mirabilis]|uniref:FUSC family protein n=1 Tax=Streptomyces mirabilis TaxID=68239 RepID=UPI003659A72E